MMVPLRPVMSNKEGSPAAEPEAPLPAMSSKMHAAAELVLPETTLWPEAEPWPTAEAFGEGSNA